MPSHAFALAHHALAVYAEPLVVRRRVALFGRDEAVADRLAELGAREVVLVANSDDAAALRSGTFDLAIVPDLGAFGDPAEVLVEVRRLVVDGGAALVAAANRDAGTAQGTRAFDYYELFDCIARDFPDVRMIAQVPFEGVALAVLGNDDESPAVSVDTQLVEDARVPDVFVALASDGGIALEPYAIFELPPSPPPPLPPPPLPVPPPVARRSESEILAPLQAELARERLRAEAVASQLEAVRPQLARVDELERELADRGRAIAALSSEVEALRSAAEAGVAAAAQVEQLAHRAERAERALAQMEPEVERMVDAHAGELANFEAVLRERAASLRELESEVARRERIVRELVAALEEHQNQQAPVQPETVSQPVSQPSEEATGAWLEDNARLRERLDALALDLARREAEAQASGWKISELERRLAEPSPQRPASAPSTPRGPSPAELQTTLAAALDELDALRRALAQEHEQRQKVESALKKAEGTRPVEVEPTA